jgi:hypothetical protein
MSNNIQTIEQAKSVFADGQILTAIQVTLDAVYEHKKLTTKNGDTTVQNVKLSDSTGTIFASVWGCEDWAPHKGRTYVIHSNKGTRGLAGISVKDKADKTGAIKRELQISKSATVQFVEVYAQAKGAAAPAQATVKQNVAVAASGGVTLGILAKFWATCFKTATEFQTAYGFGEDIKQGMIGSLFIQGVRDNLHLKQSEEVIQVTAQIQQEAKHPVIEQAKAILNAPAQDDSEDCPF